MDEEEFSRLIRELSRPEQTGGSEIEGGAWSALFKVQPQGGGPFGGRDNAAMKMLGFLRAKRFPFDVALEWMSWWNQRYLSPPLEDADLRDKIARGWSAWLEGGLPDDRPETAGKAEGRKLEFIDLDRLAELAAEANDTEWIVQDLIIAGGIHYITAPPGGGKTWAAVDLARACLTGTKWLAKQDAKRIPVLYINEEMGPGTFHRRLTGMGIEGPGLTVLHRAGVRIDSGDDLEQIVDHIKVHGVRLVIVDTFVRVHRLDENSNVEMALLFQRLKAISEAGAAVVCLHHHRKSGTGSAVEHEAMRGAGEIAAQADLIAAIDKSDGVYTFKVTKHRHLEDDAVPPFGFGIDTDDSHRTTICSAELPSTASTLPVQGREARGGTSSLSGRILALLEDFTGLGVNEIVQKVKARKESVIRALEDLEARDQVIVMQEGQRKLYHRSEF